MPAMLYAKHMESCEQLLECYDSEIMEVFNEVRNELSVMGWLTLTKGGLDCLWHLNHQIIKVLC